MRNAASFNEAMTYAPRSDRKYDYRRIMGMISSAEFLHFHDDFNRSAASNVASGWLAAIIDTGATLVTSTTAGSLGATGGALIASDGTSEGAANYLNKAVQLTAAKRFFMEVRVQTSVAAETDVQFGLSDLTATTNPEDLWTTTSDNVVAFGLLAGSAYPKLLADKTNSGSTAEIGTIAMSNTTWATLGISFDGTYLAGWVDGQISVAWSQATTTVPTGVALSPFFGARTGATAGNVTTFDYLRYSIER